MKKIIVVITFLSTLSIISCKKDEEVKEKTTLEKIQAKWGVDNISLRYSDSSDPSSDENITLPGTSDDYFDFRSDGKVYILLSGEYDTSTYALSGDKTLLFENSGSFEIKDLTDNIFKLYSKEVAGTEALEQTFNLKK